MLWQETKNYIGMTKDLIIWLCIIFTFSNSLRKSGWAAFIVHLNMPQHLAGVSFIYEGFCVCGQSTPPEAISSLGCRRNSSSGSMLIRQLTKVQLLISFKGVSVGLKIAWVNSVWTPESSLNLIRWWNTVDWAIFSESVSCVGIWVHSLAFKGFKGCFQPSPPWWWLMTHPLHGLSLWPPGLI